MSVKPWVTVRGTGRVWRPATAKSGWLLFFALVWALAQVHAQSIDAASLARSQSVLVIEGGPERVIDVVNKSPNKWRSELAVFTPDFGWSTRTSGVYEVTVEDGLVAMTRPDGGSTIPSNGYVLSASPSLQKWIQENVPVGAHVRVVWDKLTERTWTATTTLDGINRGRGMDQLVAYTVDSGLLSTGTNQWGTEVTVEKGFVTRIGGNDHDIPGDGFVLSALGRGREWLEKHARIGVRAELRGNQVRMWVDADSYRYALKESLNRIRKRMLTFNPEDIDPKTSEQVGTLQDVANQVDRLVELGKQDDAIRLAQMGLTMAEQITNRLEPLRSVELRGVHYRPVERSLVEVQDTVKRLADAGFNVVFLETFYWGQTIYPSGVAQQLEPFRGWDPLLAWVTEAQRQGIEVHAWIHAYYVGGGDGRFLRTHPDWLAVQRAKAEGREADRPQEYLDPGIPAVERFVLNLVDEMLRTYPIRGLHLDHIRLPEGATYDAGYSYSQLLRERYQREFGLDPLRLTPASNRAWAKWTQWKEDQITELVRKIRRRLWQVRPDMVISASVLRDPDRARELTSQDWLTWANEGLLDFVVPMLYTLDTDYLKEHTSSFLVRSIANRTFISTGVGQFIGLNPEATSKQMAAANAGGSLGSVIFSLNTLLPDHLRTLTEGLYRRPAVPPYRTAEALTRHVGRLSGSCEGHDGIPTLMVSTIRQLKEGVLAVLQATNPQLPWMLPVGGSAAQIRTQREELQGLRVELVAALAKQGVVPRVDDSWVFHGTLEPTQSRLGRCEGELTRAVDLLKLAESQLKIREGLAMNPFGN